MNYKTKDGFECKLYKLCGLWHADFGNGVTFLDTNKRNLLKSINGKETAILVMQSIK